jgi:hypothetical protein
MARGSKRDRSPASGARTGDPSRRPGPDGMSPTAALRTRYISFHAVRSSKACFSCGAQLKGMLFMRCAAQKHAFHAARWCRN